MIRSISSPMRSMVQSASSAQRQIAPGMLRARDVSSVAEYGASSALVMARPHPPSPTARGSRPRSRSAHLPENARMRRRSPADEPAVDDQVDAGAEARGVAEQEDRRPDHLLRGGHPAERGVGLEPLDLFGDLG